MSGTSTGSKLGSKSGNITKAKNRGDEKTMRALIKEYNEIARREGYNLYREGFKVSKKSAKVKKIGSVPDVIQGKAQRGRTAVVKKDLTKNILDYEKEKYQEKKKEASKDIEIINKREEKMRNKK